VLQADDSESTPSNASTSSEQSVHAVAPEVISKQGDTSHRNLRACKILKKISTLKVTNLAPFAKVLIMQLLPIVFEIFVLFVECS
jgi:hypothetical protein